MSKTLQPINTNQPLVQSDGKPTRTTTAFFESLRKPVNKVAVLNPDTATLPDLIRALQDN